MASRDELIAGRYKVLKSLGHGTYGQVYQALDTQSSAQVAVKIIRREDRYEVAAIKERNVLLGVQRYFDAHIMRRPVTQQRIERMALTDGDPPMLSSEPTAACVVTQEPAAPNVLRDGCVTRMLHSFPYRGHICIVMPLYGPSLTSLISMNPGVLPPEWSRGLLQSMCKGISEIHAAGYVHTDLKPDNILLREASVKSHDCVGGDGQLVRLHLPRSASLVVIDLGSAVKITEGTTHIICTRQYRPPEVILGLRWGRSADIWSLGCIAFEVVTGRMLFHTHDSWEHLALIERIVGPPPAEMAEAAMQMPKASNYFIADARSQTGYRVAWPPQTVQPGYRVERRSGSDDEVAAAQSLGSQLSAIQTQPYLMRLISACLRWRPEDRPTIDQVLQDPYFTYRTAEVNTVTDGEIIETKEVVCSSSPRSIPLGTSAPLNKICNTIAGYLTAVATVLDRADIRQLVAEAMHTTIIENRYIMLVAASGVARAAQMVPESAEKLRNADRVADSLHLL